MCSLASVTRRPSTVFVTGGRRLGPGIPVGAILLMCRAKNSFPPLLTRLQWGGHLSRRSPRKRTSPGRRGSSRAPHACGRLSRVGLMVESEQALAEILQCTGNGGGEGGWEGAESRGSAQDSQPGLGGHIREWLGVGGTREDEIMNGRPRTSTRGILIELLRERTLCAWGGSGGLGAGCAGSRSCDSLTVRKGGGVGKAPEGLWLAHVPGVTPW